jgi:tRNA dimethylallyltransferase
MISKKYSKENKKAVIICGPTGSGKSALGMAVCERFGGSIIGADSRQIYKKLDIGTAKPSIEDMWKIPHYIVDIIDITGEFTAVKFDELAKDSIEQIFAAGRIPVVVGGAGLYLEALTRGIVDAPPKNDEIRKGLERRIEQDGCEKLHDELREIDPESADIISPNDPVRIVRALELFELSGMPASLIRRTGSYRPPEIRFLWIGINLPRDTLYERIDARVDLMVTAGLIDEVKRLVDDGLGEALKAKKIVGYTEILNGLEGDYSMDEAINLIKRHTRNYAKRQMTWFRNRLSPKWINPLETGFHDKVFELIDDYLKRT